MTHAADYTEQRAERLAAHHKEPAVAAVMDAERLAFVTASNELDSLGAKIAHNTSNLFIGASFEDFYTRVELLDACLTRARLKLQAIRRARKAIEIRRGRESNGVWKP